MKQAKFLMTIVLLTIFSAFVSAELNMVITPENPTSEDNLACSIAGSSSSNFIFKWANEQGTKNVNSNIVDADQTSPGETWICRVYYPSWPAPILLGEKSVTISAGSQPITSLITIEPTQPDDNSDLTAKVNGQNAPNYIYKWNKEGTSILFEMNPLTKDKTLPGDTWTVRVYYPSWPAPILIGQASVTIQGPAPAGIVSILPAEPKTADELKCTIGNSQNQGNYIFKWYKNRQYIEEAISIPASETKKGEQWNCKVYYPSWPAPILIGQDTKTIKNTPPTLESIPNQQITTGNLFTYQVIANDPDTNENTDRLSFSLITGPEGMSINEQGLISWSSPSEASGDYLISVIVRDNEGAQDTKTFNLKVNLDIIPPLNHLPIISVSDQTIFENQLLTFQVTATDSDLDTLTYSYESLPVDASFDPQTQTFSWTPTHQQIGQHQATFKVSDGRGEEVKKTITITVQEEVITPNHPPVFTPILPQVIEENEFLTFQVTATDSDLDTLTYSYESLPVGASFDSQQVFSWTPTHQQIGQHQAIFKVSDGRGEEDRQIVTIIVQATLEEENHSPVFDQPLENQETDEMQPLNFQIHASDPDQNSMTFLEEILSALGFIDSHQVSYAVESDRTELNNALDPNTGAFSWTPSYDFVKHPQREVEVTAKFTVRDENGAEASQTIKITIHDINQAPIALLQNLETVKNTPLDIFLSGQDSDTEDQAGLLFVIQDYPVHGILIGAQDNIIYVPSPNFIGTDSFTFTVVDPLGTESQSATVTINVKEGTTPPQNHLPVFTPIGPQVIEENKPLIFRVLATDQDHDPLTYSYESLPVGASFDSQQVFSWTPTHQQIGPHTVIFKVSDGKAIVSQTVSLTVTEAPPVIMPVKITSAPDLTATKDELYQYQIRAAANSGASLTYLLYQGPQSIAINQNGLLTWTPKAQGRVCVILKVIENSVNGFSDSQHFCIDVRDTEKSLKFTHVALLPDTISAGDDLSLSVSLSNDGNIDLNDLKVTLFVYDLNLRQTLGPFDLKKNSRAQKNFHLEIPVGTMPGEYTLQIIARNDELSHVVHRTIKTI